MLFLVESIGYLILSLYLLKNQRRKTSEGSVLCGKDYHCSFATILFGYLGLIIGAMLNLEGYLGVIFSIATMGAFILHSIESKK